MVSGVVEQVVSRPLAGGATLYSLKVGGKFYGFGRAMPACQQGNTVQFDASMNQKGYMQGDINSFKVVNESVAAAPAVGASWQKRGAQQAEKDEYWTKKGERDILNDKLRNIGAGRNTAIEFVKLLLQVEAVKLPAKQPEKAQALFELVEEYRVQFENATETPAAPAAEATETPAEETEWQ